MTRAAITVIGPRDRGKYRTAGTTIVVNTTSRAGAWSSGLSPFLLGPVDLYDGHVTTNVENGWQYAKVYAEHVDAKGNPTKDYWRWAKAGWANPRAVRYPMGKGRKPEYLWWDGHKLDYVTARLGVYVPLYARSVFNNESYQHVQSLRKTHERVCLWDFDGYDHRALGMTYVDVLKHPTRKMGHAFVLAMLLDRTLVVNDAQHVHLRLDRIR